MSVTLYVLVVLQGTTLTFSPGYTSKEECLAQYKGPYIGCFAYDPAPGSWTAFFRLADGSLRTVGHIYSEAECQRYIGAFKSDVPAACRQLAMPITCSVSCRPAEPFPPQPAPTPPAVRPETENPKGDPAAFREVIVGPTPIKETDRAFLEPRPAPKARTARRARYPQRQQFTFDPIGTLFAWLSPQDW
jgi:hypothetical protein